MDNYLITDGTRYISKRKNGQYVAEDNDDKALVLPRSEAEKVLKNNLNRAFRKIFRLQKTDKEIVFMTPSDDKQQVKETLLDQCKEIINEGEELGTTDEYLTTLSDVMKEAEKYLDSNTYDNTNELFIFDTAEVATAEEPEIVEPLIEEVEPIIKKKPKTKKESRHYDTPVHQDDKFMADMKMVAGYFRDAANKKKQVQDKLDLIEKEILDIRHYIEFKSLNACEGYNAYKMLRQRLIARRECKNELRILEVLTANVFTTKDIVGIEGIIDSFDTVVYKPRVLTNLFEEKEKTV
jgi:hypothetical protein